MRRAIDGVEVDGDMEEWHAHFERLFSSYDFPNGIPRREGGGYLSNTVQTMWQGYVSGRIDGNTMPDKLIGAGNG